LVIHSFDDDPSHHWIPLPDKSGGKLYDRAHGRKVLELSEADKKNHPNGLLSFARNAR
jgi:hypothetical protein